MHVPYLLHCQAGRPDDGKKEKEAAVLDLARSAPAFMPHAPASRSRPVSFIAPGRGQGAMNSPPNSRKWSRDEAGAGTGTDATVTSDPLIPRIQSARPSRQRHHRYDLRRPPTVPRATLPISLDHAHFRCQTCQR